MIERYTLPVMGKLWEIENKYQKWLDVEIAVGGTFTNTWIIDGTAVSTTTYTNTNSFERYYIDFQPFPPGARGYLIQQSYNSNVPMRLRKSFLDIERIGIKGLSRIMVVDAFKGQK